MTYECLERSPIISQERITLLIFGKTGSGISTTANTILSENGFPVRTSMVPSSDTSYSCAKKSEGEEIMIFTVPDLLTLNPESRDQCVTELKQRLESEHISAVLMAIRADNRFLEDQYELYSLMKKDLPGEVMNNLIVVFTASSGFNYTECESSENKIQPIIRDAKVCVFIDNKASNYRKAVQVCKLLTAVDRLKDRRAPDRTLGCGRAFILLMKDLWCLLQLIPRRYYILLCVLLLFGIILFLILIFHI